MLLLPILNCVFPPDCQTCSRAAGDVVPIPTLPENVATPVANIVSLSVPFVLKIVDAVADSPSISPI